MTKLRLVFMGTPVFAVGALHWLRHASHDIVGVYCQPPKPAGRGQKEQKSPVQTYAEEHGMPVFTPTSLRNSDEQKKFAALHADIAVVAAYGLILPKEILQAPRLGCLNIHASLLPRWRGAAPIQRAILAGDTQTGITIMQMDEGLDTGAMLMKAAVPIHAHTTAPDLHDILAALGAKMIVQVVEQMAGSAINATPQPNDGVTYAAKLTRNDAAIDWQQAAAVIDRQIRALNPWPGAFFKLNDENIKILVATPITSNGMPPGTLLDEQCSIACGNDALRITQLQRPGKMPTSGADFLRGARLAVGYQFGNGA
jgi:methionyl-tRNA formyltransferase